MGIRLWHLRLKIENMQVPADQGCFSEKNNKTWKMFITVYEK
jgi:hypothetical protein